MLFTSAQKPFEVTTSPIAFLDNWAQITWPVTPCECKGYARLKYDNLVS